MIFDTTFLVSVIIPAYNVENFIDEALDSVLSQTIKNIEVIIVNDGSTDNTGDVVKKYFHLPNIIYIYQENRGVSSARNKGIEIARGLWIAFLDGDDVWERNKLEYQLKNIGKYCWSYTNSYFFGKGYVGASTCSEVSEMFSGYIFNRLLVVNSITTSTVLIKKEVLDDFGGFDTTLEALEDWELWLRISQEYEVKYIDIPLIRYRIHSQSSTRDYRKTLKWHLEFIDRIFENPKIARRYKFQKNKTLSHSYSIISYIAEEQADYQFALLMALRAFMFQPEKLIRFKRILSTLCFYVRNVKKNRNS